jgi:hypothetical protein
LKSSDRRQPAVLQPVNVTCAAGASYLFDVWCKAWPNEKCVLPLASSASGAVPTSDERLIVWPYESSLAQVKGIIVRRFVEETPILLAAVWQEVLNDSDGG